MLLVLMMAVCAQVPTWRDLPQAEPLGERAHTGSFVVKAREEAKWSSSPFQYDAQAATGRKLAKVVVLIYDPVLKSQSGKRLSEWLNGTDPVEASRILADVVRQASWGYMNYDIVDVIRVDGYPLKVDGFRYDETTYLEARQNKQWQPASASYRAFFEENGLIDRFVKEQISELWVWGADGFHFDKFAGMIPNRYARYAPTENPWFYRPYDIPEDLGRTTWVMGFNVEVGVDNAIHSYVHRVESMAALAYGAGEWDPKRLDDPWNTFSRTALESQGQPAHVGNCHCPPNGNGGYDYGNRRRVASWAWHWWRFPDLRGEAWTISSNAWGGTQFGYVKWILERLPKAAGETRFGYNNWWIHVANTDLELPELEPTASDTLLLPAASARSTRP